MQCSGLHPAIMLHAGFEDESMAPRPLETKQQTEQNAARLRAQSHVTVDANDT